MKKLFVVLILLLGVLFTLPKGKMELGTSILIADTTVFNPNGSSELADLMREMQQYSVEERQRVINLQATMPAPESIRNIHIAKITGGMKKGENYSTFSDLYLASLDAYANSKNDDRAKNFNNMIATCLACHSENCPGPLPAIRKLQISSE